MFDSRLPHRERSSFSGRAPARQAGSGGFDPHAPHQGSGGEAPIVDQVTVAEWHTQQAENLCPHGRVGSTPTGDTDGPGGATGRRGRLKSGMLRVRLPPRAPKMCDWR